MSSNEENFQGGGTSISNLRNAQQHPAQKQQMMMQQPPQGQPIPQQMPPHHMRQQMPPQMQAQMMQQRPTQPMPSIPRTETFIDTVKGKPWKEIVKSFGIIALLFLTLTNPYLIKKIYKSLPFEKQTKNSNYLIFAILVLITSFIVTIINKFVLCV